MQSLGEQNQLEVEILNYISINFLKYGTTEVNVTQQF